MKLGLSSLHLIGQPFQTLLTSIASSKVENWEIVDDIAHRLNEGRARRLQKLKKKLGLRYTVHAPFEDLNIASLNPKTRKIAVDELSRSIRFAARIDAEVWVVHPGLHSGLSWAYPGLQWKLNLEAPSHLKGKAEDLGLCVAIENMPRDHFVLGSSQDFLTFFAEGPMLGTKMTLDVGHANTHNEIDEFFAKLGGRICHMHIHDNHGRSDEHNTIGRGTTDWVAVTRFVRNEKFSGFLIVESTSGTMESYKKACENAMSLPLAS